jgi:NAD+ synthase
LKAKHFGFLDFDLRVDRAIVIKGLKMKEYSKDVLKLDCEAEANRISEFISEQVRLMRREGAVIGISGGIDSALASEICVRALGKERVFGLILPEKESNIVSKVFATKHTQKLGIESETVDITPALEGMGTYKRRDEFVKELFPEYDSNYRIKITLPPDLLDKDAFNIFTLTIDDGKGNQKSERLSKSVLNGIVAASNTKQRTRMVYLYYYAEKMNYIVCGTTNRSETVQGFFVKYGDGGVDIEPLAHLYKTQVYQLSEHLGVVKEIIRRPPSPDTYTYEVSDEEFFFRMPFDTLDLLLYAWENDVPVEDVCSVMGLGEEQVKRAFRDFNSKAKTTEHSRNMPPSLF